MSFAWRTVQIISGGERWTAITRWRGSRIWSGLPTDTVTAPRLAEAIGRAMWAWTGFRAGTGDSRADWMPSNNPTPKGDGCGTEAEWEEALQTAGVEAAVQRSQRLQQQPARKTAPEEGSTA